MAQSAQSIPIQQGQPLWWMAYQRFIGLDIHKEYVTAVGIDLSEKEVLRVRRIAIADFADWCAQKLTAEDAVIIESTTNAWTVYDTVAPLVGRAVVMHPDRKKQVKTDIADARELAFRLMRNDFKEVWVPPCHVRDLRELMAYRYRKVAERTRIRNRLKSVLHAAGIRQPAERLLANKRREWWAQLDVSDTKRLKIELDLATFDDLSAQIVRLDKQLGTLSTSDEWGSDMTYLMQVPGIGLIHAITILSAIGDITRFDSPQQLVGYAGLGARVEQSGKHEKRGRITKSGRRELRRSLIEAARVAVRQKGRWMKTYQRLERRIGDKKAVVAIARKLLVAIWHLLIKQTLIHDIDPKLLADKLLKWAWQCGRTGRRGMKCDQFLRFHLAILGFREWGHQLIFGGKTYPIASFAALCHDFPDLTADPRLRLVVAQSQEP